MSLTNFRSILIFASCVVGTRNMLLYIVRTVAVPEVLDIMSCCTINRGGRGVSIESGDSETGKPVPRRQVFTLSTLIRL